MKKLIASLLLLASVAVAQPTYDITADVNYPDRNLQPLTFLQGATPEMRVYIEQAGSAYTNIGSDSLVFYYGTSGNASSYVQVTNSAVDTTSGYFTVNFTAANLNTNGSFWYTVLLKDGSGGMYYSGDGALEIKKTTVTGSPGALELVTPLDWDGFEYSNAGDGPTIGDGTTITAVTNSGGQLVLSSASSGVAWGAITGTLADQTDLQSALDAKGVGDFLADGSVPMTGDFNGGGQDGTNFGNVTASATITAEQITSTDDITAAGTVLCGLGGRFDIGSTAVGRFGRDYIVWSSANNRDVYIANWDVGYDIGLTASGGTTHIGQTPTGTFMSTNITFTTAGTTTNTATMDSDGDFDLPNDLTVAGDVLQNESATNGYTKTWYSASNRWAEVYIKGSVTNVVFTSPVM